MEQPDSNLPAQRINEPNQTGLVTRSPSTNLPYLNENTISLLENKLIQDAHSYEDIEKVLSLRIELYKKAELAKIEVESKQIDLTERRREVFHNNLQKWLIIVIGLMMITAGTLITYFLSAFFGCMCISTGLSALGIRFFYPKLLSK